MKLLHMQFSPACCFIPLISVNSSQLLFSNTFSLCPDDVNDQAAHTELQIVSPFYIF
jgi:hypothetical protein